jgi:hypothetical protein
VGVLDPACGLGDLLLAAADHIPAAWPAWRRVAHLYANFHGRDLIPVLVDGADARLALWATMTGAYSETVRSPVCVGDAFGDDLDWRRYGLVVLNPPYAVRKAPTDAKWATGNVTAAASFVLETLTRARSGARIAAILPDVLRSGSRYRKWRSELEKIAEVVDIDVYGQFDPWTDVDVFVAHLRRRDARSSSPLNSWYASRPAGTKCLADLATVSVGDVVPHRDVPSGGASPYLTVDALPAWATTIDTPLTIRHGGRLHSPPFVALRRTSAPTRVEGSIRVRAAVYAGIEPVAVENHLIVIRPSDGGVASCMRILDGLRQPAVTRWLDERLRLRHLTVAALRELPLDLAGIGDREP